MLILTRHDLESLLTIGDTIGAVENGFAQLSAGDVVMPQRVPLSFATTATPVRSSLSGWEYCSPMTASARFVSSRSRTVT